MNNQIGEHPAVAQANRSSDYLVYGLVVAAAVLTLLGFFAVGLISALLARPGTLDPESQLPPLIAFLLNNLTVLFVMAVAFVAILVLVRMLRQQLIGSALLVQYSEYAWLRDWSAKVAADLRMPEVEIVITQDPNINAFALGFMRPYNIVLNSGTIRWLTDEQLKAVVVHEMAHIKYKHTAMGVYVQVLGAVPIMGPVFQYFLGFWNRRTELTCDRLALCYLRDPELIKQALIAVHVGPDAAPSFTTTTQAWQAHKANNVFNRFTQSFGTHPFLWRRLEQIDASYQQFASSWLPEPVAEPQPQSAQSPQL